MAYDLLGHRSHEKIHRAGLPERAEHDDVEALWYSGSAEGVRMVEFASASNMKRTWCPSPGRDWFGPDGEGREFLREACQVKNIWIPYGE